MRTHLAKILEACSQHSPHDWWFKLAIRNSRSAWWQNFDGFSR
jgi:hypothetical protein